MKHLIIISGILLLGISCKHEIPDIANPKKNAFYYIREVDIDNQMSVTQVFHVQNRSVTSSPAQQDSHNHDKDYCKRHPHDPKCICTPVLFADVSIKWENGHVVFRWTSPIEYNVKQYDIMQSTDGNDYTTIGVVLPKGQNSKYEFVY